MTLLRRLCYLLIPLSILLIKYYPEIGRQYDSWTGAANVCGSYDEQEHARRRCAWSAGSSFSGIR